MPGRAFLEHSSEDLDTLHILRYGTHPQLRGVTRFSSKSELVAVSTSQGYKFEGRISSDTVFKDGMSSC